MRTDPDKNAPELTMLSEYLDVQREIMLFKSEGLTKSQMAQPLPPSDMTLAGLLYHLALVEEAWLEVRFAGLPRRDPWIDIDWDADPDWEWRTAQDLEPDAVRQRYEEACERSRQVVTNSSGADQVSVASNDKGVHFTLRWVLLHLIEETARHAGHADLIRQSIDGLVGE
jgi:uncharacterized damage-inducible protein DinB